MNEERYRKHGFALVPGVFADHEINALLREAKSVFWRQFLSRGYAISTSIHDSNEEVFNALLYRLYDDDFPRFTYCGKQIQHLISLHRLSLDERIVQLLARVGHRFPCIATRPVLYFNHPRLASEPIYSKVEAHQDWRSMQGSLNSVVVWVPLAPLSSEVGPLHVLPGSHLRGLVTSHMEKGFGMVRLSPAEKNDMVPVLPKVGDVLIFSSFLVHQSGENTSDRPRWSCHFRYNDLAEDTFVERGYCHPYVYQPTNELLTPGFPNTEQVKAIFHPGSE